MDTGRSPETEQRERERSHETTPLVSSPITARYSLPTNTTTETLFPRIRQQQRCLRDSLLLTSRVVVDMTVALMLWVLIHAAIQYVVVWRSSPATSTAFKGTPTSPAGSAASTTTTQYGEVWLIRHGEKDEVPPLSESCARWWPGDFGVLEQQHHPDDNNDDDACHTRERLKAMYELSPQGWTRAHHLADLVRNNSWPRFAALYATRPATPTEMRAVYPSIAKDATGQSLVQREYQTLLPLGGVLNRTIETEFSKGEVAEAALDIARAAVAAAAASNNNSIVLVSWDHCSLPTLVVEGFGCKDDHRCYRCWNDDRFGDVLKLNVTLETTTIAASTAATTTAIDNIRISSTILAMTGEAFPTDDYYYLKNNNTAAAATTNRPTSIEQSTPCTPSYCSARPAAKHLVPCSCWDS